MGMLERSLDPKAPSTMSSESVHKRHPANHETQKCPFLPLFTSQEYHMLNLIFQSETGTPWHEVAWGNGLCIIMSPQKISIPCYPPPRHEHHMKRLWVARTSTMDKLRYWEPFGGLKRKSQEYECDFPVWSLHRLSSWTS